MKRKIGYIAGAVVLATLSSAALAAQDKSDIDPDAMKALNQMAPTFAH
jgi:hypothetical protein